MKTNHPPTEKDRFYKIQKYDWTHFESLWSGEVIIKAKNPLKAQEIFKRKYPYSKIGNFEEIKHE